MSREYTTEEYNKAKDYLEKTKHEDDEYDRKIAELNPIPNYSDIEKVMISMYELGFIVNTPVDDEGFAEWGENSDDDTIGGRDIRCHDLFWVGNVFPDYMSTYREIYCLHINDRKTYRAIGKTELHLICRYFGIDDEINILNEMVQIGFTEYHENDKLYYIIRNPVYIRWVRKHNGFIDVYPDDDYEAILERSKNKQ